MPQIPNGIGQFIIGQSSIGDHPFDYTQTLYSQYANSPVLVSWVDYFSQWIDANKNVDMFYDQLWNIQTAQGYGLDVWGRIVGLNPGRVLPVFPTPFFGFSEAGILLAYLTTGIMRSGLLVSLLLKTYHCPMMHFVN